MDEETLGERLKAARNAKLWNQSKLARLAGIKQSTISKLESGTQSTSTDVAVIANALGVDALWLASGSRAQDLQTVANQKATIGTLSLFTDDEVMLYQYADPRCGMGINAGNPRKPELPHISVSQTTMRNAGISPDVTLAFVQNDAAMGGTIAEGDECIIRTDQRSVAAWNGRIFAIATGENVTVRRIFTRTNGGYRIVCDSHDTQFQDDLLDRAEAEALNIIGRLCWSSGEK